MITELFVENYPVDVSAEIDTLMTYCIDDIKDFSARNTTFSKTIVIPGTAKNNKVFGNIFELSSGTLTNDDDANVNYNYNIAKSARCIMFPSHDTNPPSSPKTAHSYSIWLRSMMICMILITPLTICKFP